MKHYTAIPEIKYYIINIIDSHQIYWLSDQQQEIDTIQNNNINIIHKRSADQSLNLSLSRANEIKISIMSARADPPLSHIVLSQTGFIFSKITYIKS